jgi:hypothetical protein
MPDAGLIHYRLMLLMLLATAVGILVLIGIVVAVVLLVTRRKDHRPGDGDKR